MTPSEIAVRQATIADVDLIVPLFDAYRQFYKKPSDPEGARRFLRERFENSQSVIFIASDGSSSVGFTQLYPSFSSAALARIFILNDLFTIPKVRRHGVASALLQAAADHGRLYGAARLVLSTEIANTTAQYVYERLGWKRDTVFYTYEFTL